MIVELQSRFFLLSTGLTGDPQKTRGEGNSSRTEAHLKETAPSGALQKVSSRRVKAGPAVENLYLRKP